MCDPNVNSIVQFPINYKFRQYILNYKFLDLYKASYSFSGLTLSYKPFSRTRVSKASFSLNKNGR